MIPYEELVIALQTWRAKQGLPLGQLSGALTPPVHAAPPPPRAAPPMAPPSTGRTGPQQAYVAPVEESIDVEDAALIEEGHYENEGQDFGIAFGAKQSDDNESTVIGGAPTAPDETAEVPKSNRNEEW